MKSYHLFLFQKEHGGNLDESCSQVVLSYLKRCEDLTSYHSADICPQIDKLAVTVSDSLITAQNIVSILDWTDVRNVHDLQLCENTTASESLPDSLHSLSESLPKYGFQLNVIWVRDAPWCPVMDDLDLFGALKKLSCWYNAHIQLVPWSNQDEDGNLQTNLDGDIAQPQSWGSVESWASVLCGQVLPSMTAFTRTCTTPLWKGDVKLYPNENEEAVVLPGFTLTPHQPRYPRVKWTNTDQQSVSHDRIYGRHLSLTAMVDVRDIPSFYVTDVIYEICVNCAGKNTAKSKQFLNVLRDEPNVGYLVQLSHATSWKEITKSKKQQLCRKKSTDKEIEKSWFDEVIENPHGIGASPYDVQFCGDCGVDNFLLINGKNRLGEPVVKAIRMRSAHDISGKAARVLVTLDKSVPPDVIDSSDMELPDIPLYDGGEWLEVESDIQNTQEHVLQEWTAHMKETGEDELFLHDVTRLMMGTRATYMEKYRAKYGGITQHSLPEPTEREFIHQKPEHDHPLKQMERHMLMYDKSRERQLARFQSNDSIGGLSPPSKGQVVKLSEDEFLKHFHPDSGLARKHKLTKLHTKRCKVPTKYTDEELRETGWPQCSHFHYHDIYYNLGKSPEKAAAKSAKLMTWLQRSETLSTCSRDRSQKPQEIVVKDTAEPITTRTTTQKPTNRKRSLNTSNVTPPLHNKARRRSLTIQTPPRITAVASAKRRKTLSSPPGRITAKRGSTPRTTTPSGGQVGKSPDEPDKTTPQAESLAQKKAAAGSRSERHKRKLEDACVRALESQGVKKTDDRTFFKSCFTKLYNMSYGFIKDLRGYKSLTEEMEKITAMQAPTIVYCERASYNK